MTVPLQTPVAPPLFAWFGSSGMDVWEYLIVGMTALADGTIAVLMKKPRDEDVGAEL